MRKQFLFVIAILFVTIQSDVFGQQLDKISYALHDDFETGELFGWEAYPYAQDIGFDALYFARNNPTYNGSRYALARPQEAHDTNELYHGFTKRLNFWTIPETVLQCAIYFQGDRNPESLEISLGTFDGRRFVHTISNPKANQWLELDIPIKDFHFNDSVLGAGEHIQVVTVKGSYSIVYYHYTYTILMDDFRINGERQRRFVSSAPTSIDFEPFDVSILNKHFVYGEDVGLNVVPEDNIPLREVKATLVDSEGTIVKKGIDLTLCGEQWVNNAIYRIQQKDSRGQWEIQLTGRTEQGKEVKWGFKFLVPGKEVNQYPRLFFSADELEDRLRKETSPTAERILGRALESIAFMDVDIDAIHEAEDRTAENLVGGPYAKLNTSGYNSFSAWIEPMRQLADVVREGSFRYAFTGDKAAAEQAKKALLKLCAFSKWNNHWMLERKFWTYWPIGYVLGPIGYGYDMLHDVLTDAERKLVRDAIMEKGLKLFYRDMVEMNRMPSNQSNHIAVIVAGYGIAAMAIYGEDDENPYLEPYMSGIITKAKTLIDLTYYKDGSYAEPTKYIDMASKSIVELLATYERNFGVDYTTTTNVQKYYHYPLYVTHDTGLIQTFGDDSKVYLGFDTHIHTQWMVHRMGDPFLYHYIKPLWEAGDGGYMGYLWYRDDIAPVSREILPTSRAFEAQGMVMRSGWDASSTVITTRVAPNSNHYHYDQGNFQVMANGEELFTDPGIGAGGYYGNPGFLSYNIQAIGHNVMLVDHDPESQAPAHYNNGIMALRDWPRNSHTFTSEIIDATESNLSSVYKGKLETYSRTFLYHKGGTLFLFDRVKSKSPQGEVYDWLFHAPMDEGYKRSIAVVGNRLTVDRPNARLTMDVIAPNVITGASAGPVCPAIRAVSIRDRHDTLFPESFATFSSNEGQREISFFAAIIPEAKPDQGDFGKRPVTERIESEYWMGARVQRNGGVDYGFFPKYAGSPVGVSTISGFTVDARRFAASYDGDGRLAKAYFEGLRFSADGFILRSTSPLTCAIAIALSGDMVIEVDLDLPSELTATLGQKPSKVMVDGTGYKAWKYDKGKRELAVKLPAGRHHVTIE